MHPTFILTRVFAISALFVGAFQVAYAAPIAHPDVPSVVARTDDAVGILVREVIPAIDMDTIKRVADDGVEARSPDPEPETESELKRTCYSIMACRRESESQ
ncbi:hypothetical protein BDW22DRAFT_1132395 [Trametopsis cervina]|nr:hypothetical protein BDW22DRAFT_1132395 [Trametopsis cervina]